MAEVFGVDGDAERKRIVYVGDSPNDEPMFGFFPNAVGVANVSDFVGRMRALPAYIARGRSAEGFAELADVLIAARAVAGAPELG